MLREVRNGFYVVGVFYGHPGIFVNPSHRAIAIARQEGHQAFMLPGISAEACLFADVGIDPSTSGCQTIEATDLLLRNRPINTGSHLIIFQVGIVGDSGFHPQGFKNTKLHVLLEKLTEVYGSGHRLVHYIAPSMATVEPTIDFLTLGALKKSRNARRVTGISTFYIPPKHDVQPSPSAAKKLGLKVQQGAKSRNFGRLTMPEDPYGPRERVAIDELDKHKDPAWYKRVRASQPMFDLLYRLGSDPRAAAKFKANPDKFLIPYDSDLTQTERAALLTRRSFPVRQALQPSADDVAN
ncbi:hypothetical protein EV356DRAFT_416528, partial [Viridothelium virens]